VKLGGSSEIVVNLRISNTGDQSHSTQITINTSNNTEYLGYLQPQNEPTEYVVCQNVIDVNNIRYNNMGRSPNYGRNSNILIPDPHH
jgi:hypothetical protein